MQFSKGFWRVLVVGVAGLGLAFSTLTFAAENRLELSDKLFELQTLPKTLEEIKPPKLSQPGWYKAQLAAERQRANQPSTPRAGTITVTYSVATKGITSSDLDVFAAQANQTLNDSRGWSQLGISFQQVASGGSFQLILSQASEVPSFSPGCSAEWSCRVGSAVIINDNRWRETTAAWQAAGGSLRDYRHMVINHEVGHWLGHGHAGCMSAGGLAPIMQQQSIDLQGCKFNPWPLGSELSAPNLGI